MSNFYGNESSFLESTSLASSSSLRARVGSDKSRHESKFEARRRRGYERWRMFACVSHLLLPLRL